MISKPSSCSWRAAPGADPTAELDFARSGPSGVSYLKATPTIAFES